MSIYHTTFQPTFLYIKQHSVTGLLYFGKTTKDPVSYRGSGLHWSRHLKTHGAKDVDTLWFCLFLDRDSIVEFALAFSEKENIVESNLWANMQPENGLDGAIIGHTYCTGEKNGFYGKTHTIEMKEHLARCRKNNPYKTKGNLGGTSWNKGLTKESNSKLLSIGEKISKSTKGKPNGRAGVAFSESHKLNMAGPKQTQQCIHCGRTIAVGMHTRFHGDKCKLRKE